MNAQGEDEEMMHKVAISEENSALELAAWYSCSHVLWSSGLKLRCV